MKRYSLDLAVALVSVAAFFAACEAQDAALTAGAPGTCGAGELASCDCPDGVDGSRMCNEDGTAYYPCFCGSEPTSDNDASPSATGSGGAGTGPATGGAGGTMVGLSPTPGIQHPDDLDMRMVDSSIPFDGSGIDPEDGILGDAALVWTSDVQGDLGTGANIMAALSTTGLHVITLTATDSDGNTGTASITVDIIP